MTQTHNGLMDDLSTLRQDLEGIRSDIAALSKNLINEGEKKIKSVKKEASNVASKVMDSVDSLKDNSNEVIQEVRAKVEENPILTLAAAVGIGYMLGKFVCRK